MGAVVTPVRIKVCGITRLEDALRAAELGVDAIGFVFWPGSPRFIAPSEVWRIAARLPAPVSLVGVFVDQEAGEIRTTAARVGLSAVQLHGCEDERLVRDVGGHVLKAVGLRAGDDPEAIVRTFPSCTLLLDAHDPVRRGGTGRTIDWALAAQVASRRRVVLSGGLTPENVGAAVRAVRPWGVDVSSGIEERPGVKHHDRLADFVRAVRAT